MEIIVAKNAGFCFGVQRAIQAVYDNLSSHGRIYTLGPIIHNPQVVEELIKKGVIIEEDIEKIDSGTVIIRSHGITEQAARDLKEKTLDVVDATCPYVKRIHGIVAEYAKKGYSILIIGERNHPEVIGINGWCNNRGYVIYNDQDIESLPPIEKACVVAQTTITREKCNDIIKKLESRVEELKVFNTICYATSERQREAEEIAKKASIMYVIGGRNSSNTQKLYNLCKRHCAKTYIVETINDIEIQDIRQGDVVGITAGASTPDWIIKEVVVKMNELKDEFSKVTDVQEEHQAPNEEPQVQEEHQAPNEEPQAQEEHLAQNEEHQAQEGELQVQDEQQAQDNEALSEEETTMENFPIVQLRPGLVVNGTVLQVTDEEIIVNVGYKSDGIVPIDEIYLESEQKPSDLYKEGDQIEVTVKSISSESVILSQKAVIQKKVWKEIEEAYKSGAEIEGIGSEVIKGGLIAKIKGISAFVPASQVSIRYVEDLSAFVGERLRLKVLEIDKQRNRVVASQKAILLAEEAERKRKFWDNIAEGQKITGEVKRLANFGAFVDIGGVDGLIHVSDLAWGHVHHPRDVVKEGQQVEVIVLSVDRERERVSLGYKQTLPHPWDNIEQKYPIGSIAEGKVVRITSFGAFIELESGVDGLVHISQVADRHISKVEDVLNIGDMVRVKILNVKPEEKRISLSIREAGPEEVEPPTPEDSESDNEYVKNEMTVVLGEFFPDELMEDK